MHYIETSFDAAVELVIQSYLRLQRSSPRSHLLKYIRDVSYENGFSFSPEHHEEFYSIFGGDNLSCSDVLESYFHSMKDEADVEEGADCLKTMERYMTENGN